MRPSFFGSLLLFLFSCPVLAYAQSQSSDIDTLQTILLGLGSGGFLFYTSFRTLKKKRLIENTPTSKIRSLAMGLVELKGRATKGKLLEAPLSHSSCCYYKYLVEKYMRSEKHSTWKIIAEGSSERSPFCIEDDTGTITVDPHDVEVDMEPRFRYEGTNYPQNCKDFLVKFHLNYYEGFFRPRLRFREWRIFNNEQVYLIGTAQKSATYRSEAKQSLNNYIRQIKQDAQKMKAFDTNNDGSIDAQEWEAALEQIESEHAQQQLESFDDTNSIEEVVVAKGLAEKTFVISNKSETELCKKYGIYGRLAWIGGIIMIVGSIFLLVASFLR